MRGAGGTVPGVSLRDACARREQWLVIYGATKCLAESVLRLTGTTHLMREVFHDLKVEGNAKVTTAPADGAVDAAAAGGKEEK